MLPRSNLGGSQAPHGKALPISIRPKDFGFYLEDDGKLLKAIKGE